MTKHEDLVKSLADSHLGGPRFKAFIRRWEINIEPPPKEEEKVEQYVRFCSQPGYPTLISRSRRVRPNGIGIRKWGQGRLMEAEEEDYFNTDDDEDEILPVLTASVFQKAAQGSLKRKRPRGSSTPIRQLRSPFALAPRGPPLGSLVDYDDGDDPVDKTLPLGQTQDTASTSALGSPALQASSSGQKPAQQSLRASKQISITLTPHVEEDEEDSLLESLVSRSTTGSPGPIKPPEINLNAKRQRDDDDDEMLERLAKVKRPSTGSPTKDKNELGGKPTTPGKSTEESGPKKIKLKLASPATSTTTTSPSSPGAKDGDTG